MTIVRGDSGRLYWEQSTPAAVRGHLRIAPLRSPPASRTSMQDRIAGSPNLQSQQGVCVRERERVRG